MKERHIPGPQPDGRAERRHTLISERLSQVDAIKRPSVDKRLLEIPRSLQAAYLAAVLGTASPREAIASNCLACAGWVRREVVLCTAKACPLYDYRPAQL